QRLIAIVAVLVIIAAGTYLYVTRTRRPADALTVYGSIDIREIQLAFNDSGRIATIVAQEGDRVHRGQYLAKLDPARFKDAVDQAQARLAAARHVLARLLAGSRPEEIAEARANAAATLAVWRNAQMTYRRNAELAKEHYLPQQASDDARQALTVARSRWLAAEQALRLAIKGPRQQDIDAARAQVAADAATLALADKELADTRLYAPDGGVIDNRILEPGDMTSPQSPVLTVALDNPVWARAYVSEPDLGKLRQGMRAYIASDSFPGKRFEGWIGFVSPVAEFTPKTVETTQLRTDLVYRVRVYACNPHDQLRLGMPVTVTIPVPGRLVQGLSSHPCAR
ncbi:MAG: efflux RND transporter periplasmic adaptor subunit, partial [Acidiferrobacterales bacterium]